MELTQNHVEKHTVGRINKTIASNRMWMLKIKLELQLQWSIQFLLVLN